MSYEKGQPGFIVVRRGSRQLMLSSETNQVFAALDKIRQIVLDLEVRNGPVDWNTYRKCGS